MVRHSIFLFSFLLLISCGSEGVAPSNVQSSFEEKGHSSSNLSSEQTSSPSSSSAVSSSSRVVSSSSLTVAECQNLLNLHEVDSTSTYKIGTRDELICWAQLRRDSIALGNVELTADIQFSEFDTTYKDHLDDWPKWVGNIWGKLNVTWNRKFDGKGHTISGLVLRSGFFAIIDTNGIVTNLKIDRSFAEEFNGSYRGFAGIIAEENKGTISNCHVSNSLVRADIAGGLVATNPGIIQGSTVSHSRISAAEYSVSEDAGGIAGWGDDIRNCAAEDVVVYGIKNAGGIVGSASHTTIEFNSTKSSTISAENAGGIVGKLYYSYLYSSFAIDSYLSGSRCGGISGGENDNSSVNYSYTHGINFECSHNGGISAHNLGGVDHCYADSTTNSSVSGIEPKAIVYQNSTDYYGYKGSTTDSWGITTEDLLSNWILDSLNQDTSVWIRDASINEGYPIFQWMTGK